jgi:UDP-N-acetylmuramate--alanine ligase
MRRVKKIHFIGVGGVGMCGIAEVLKNQGFKISGSDLNSSPATRRLQDLGVSICLGHDEKNIQDADVIVYSSAIKEDNPEMLAAKQKRIAMVPRAQMLAELMRFRYGIAVAGTHGKTTTTSLISSVFAHASLDPTYIIGGKLTSAGHNAKLGQGPYLIAEADESDASFMYLHPMVTIVTNIDQDHMGTYKNDFENLKETFLNFIHQVPFYGLVVLCVDDPVIQELLPQINRPVITYGFSDNADIQIKHYQQQGLQCRFDCVIKGQSYAICLNIAGRHNALNAAATIAVAREEGIEMANIQQALMQFGGIGRRFQHYEISIKDKALTVIDDYGHHPNEVLATLNTIREGWPERRLLAIFQPHRYSRTRDLFDDFASVLSKVDVLILLDVYAAGEKPIKGASSADLIRAIRARCELEPILIKEQAELATVLGNVAQTNDIVLMQGAGNISTLVQELVSQFGATESKRVAR